MTRQADVQIRDAQLVAKRADELADEFADFLHAHMPYET